MMKNDELITVREMSTICQVSRQAVYKIVNEIEQDESLTGLITVNEGVKHFTRKGQEYVKKRFNVTEEKSEETEDQNQNKENFEYKNKYIQMLEEQIKIKDEQIKGLNIAIEEIQQRQKEANILHAMEIQKLESSESDEKPKVETKGFFEKLKNMFNTKK